MKTVYFQPSWDENPGVFLEAMSKQSPKESSEWGKIRGVADPEIAEYHVGFNRNDPILDTNRVLLFASEPPVSELYKQWSKNDCLGSYPIEQHYKPQRWWISKTYDELVALDPVKKTDDLSWITTDNGRNVGTLSRQARRLCRSIGISEQQRQSIPLVNRGGTDGHILRMELLDRILSDEPGLLDLYGRGDFDGPHYRGELDDKWDGLETYRYSLAIENYSGPNYFSEKLTDALLAWCMPIYWGCTNLESFLPEDSFVRIDIEDPNAPEKIRKIVNSDLRERNIDAIAEARRRLLNEYQIWPTVERAINNLEK